MIIVQPMNKEFRKEDEQYMRKAITCAQQAFSKGEVPIGAVLVADGGANRTNGTAKVLASTYNLVETLCDATAHAEMQAITAGAAELGSKYLQDCTLYVTIEPCPMCAGAIVMADVGSVYYGASDETAGCAGSVYALPEDPAFGKKIPCMGGLMERACKEILDTFFGEKRT